MAEEGTLVGEISAEPRTGGDIAVTVRLDPELVLTMSESEVATLGALLRDVTAPLAEGRTP